MDTISGLPAHPLIVHFPLVAIPLAAILVICFTIIPSWRDVLAYLITGIGAGIAIGVFLAANSGEALEKKTDKSALLDAHTALGDQMQTIGIIFGLALVALGLYHILTTRKVFSLGTPRTHQVLVALVGLAILTSAVAVVWDVRTGHSGAKAVWTEESAGKGPDESRITSPVYQLPA